MHLFNSIFLSAQVQIQKTDRDYEFTGLFETTTKKIKLKKDRFELLGEICAFTC